MFLESPQFPQPSPAYCLVMSTLSRQRRLGCPWAKDSSVCHLGCCKSVNSIWDKVDSVQMSLTRMVQQSASSWHPCLLIHPWFPSCPLLLVWDFCDNHRETILPKTHAKETHCYDWPDLYRCCVYDDQFWDKDSGTSWGRGGISVPLFMGWEECKVIGQDSKEPPALLGVLVNQHRRSFGDMSRGCETAWNFSVLLGQIWAGNRTNPCREASNTQLSQMPFLLPKTWGYFLLCIMNLTATLLPHLFTVSIATHWYTYSLYSSVVTDLLMGDLEIEK